MSSNTLELEFTGERMVPESCQADVFWEHVYRYQFARRYVSRKDILDIACGEGYGSAALRAAGAKSVIGVDIDEVSCSHARAKYSVDARVGSAEEIPLADGSVDAVVSFETIEHLNHPERFVTECRRVLRPNGRLIVSTPNRDVCSTDCKNPFHTNELTRDEFTDVLGKGFGDIELYSQRPTAFNRRLVSTYHLSHSGRARLIGKLDAWTRPFLNPGFEPLALPETRKRVLEVIARESRRGAWVFNPNVVRRARADAADKPMYYIAVASRL